MNWYLIQTKPNAHLIASKHLKQQDLEVFLPLISKTSQKAGKFVNNIKPLFPSYLFIGAKSDSIPWRSINATRGVAKAITLDGKYRAIRKNIIEGLRLRCNANGILERDNNLVTGDQVKIENGPFTEFICRVENITESKRVWVLIELMQQRTRASISLYDLSKVN